MKPSIPYYYEINEFLESIPSDYRTANPLFYCLRMRKSDRAISNYKPPFRKDFYFIALIKNAGKTQITYDNTDVNQLSAFLVFQSPGLLYSFHRDDTAEGYLIYFKKECLSFFKSEIEKEFPFFDILHTNFFRLNKNKFNEFAPFFEEVFIAYEKTNDNRHNVASAKLLALLYQLREYTIAFDQWENGFNHPRKILYKKFIQLINSYYIDKRTVEEYARMLNVSSNYLTKVVKEESGKKPLSFLNERILNEAKSLIRFTQFDIAEIAFQLNFSDPANFGKFFKKHTGHTPLDYRKRLLVM